MGHPRRQPADPGQLLDPHRLTLRFEQLFGHGAVTVRQVTQLAGLVRRRQLRNPSRFPVDLRARIAYTNTVVPLVDLTPTGSAFVAPIEMPNAPI